MRSSMTQPVSNSVLSVYVCAMKMERKLNEKQLLWDFARDSKKTLMADTQRGLETQGLVSYTDIDKYVHKLKNRYSI